MWLAEVPLIWAAGCSSHLAASVALNTSPPPTSTLRTALQGWPKPGLHGNREAEPLQCHPNAPSRSFHQDALTAWFAISPPSRTAQQHCSVTPPLSPLPQAPAAIFPLCFLWQRVTCQRLFPQCLLKQVKPFFWGTRGMLPPVANTAPALPPGVRSPKRGLAPSLPGPTAQTPSCSEAPRRL